jgi:hypothetical protein
LRKDFPRWLATALFILIQIFRVPVFEINNVISKLRKVGMLHIRPCGKKPRGPLIRMSFTLPLHFLRFLWFGDGIIVVFIVIF